MRKFGITTYFGVNNGKTLSENLDYLKSLGFDEISEGLDYINYPLGELERLVKEKGMTIGSFHARYKKQNIASLWKNNVETANFLTSLKEDVSLCAKYGAKKLVVHIQSEDKEQNFTPTFMKNFKELVKFAEKKKVIICVENLNEIKYDIVRELVLKMKSPYVKICLDIGHYNAIETNKNLDRILNDDFFLQNIEFLHLHGNHGQRDEHLPLQYSNYDLTTLKKVFDRIPDVTLTSETLFTAKPNLSYEEQAKEILTGLQMLA